MSDQRAMDEIDYDDPRFNQGVQHVVYMLSDVVGAKDWVAGDGSEDYDDDLWQTLLNILAARDLYNKDTGQYAADDIEHLRAQLAAQIIIQRGWEDEARKATSQLASARKALEAISAASPIETGAERLRCRQCGHAWLPAEQEHHGKHCAYQIARAALPLTDEQQKQPCVHHSIINLDGKWHCQKCGHDVAFASAYRKDES